jgi:choice-of-anchor A domain-containing protein
MACSTLGPASNFTVFVFGNHTQSNTDSQGRVAVGGNVIYSNYSVGSKLPVSTTRADLIVNGNMNITGGVNFSGNSIISNAANIEKYTMTNNNGVGNQPLIESYIDFEATQKYLRCLSQRLSEQPSTGDVQPQSWGGLYLIGNDPNLNIFTFDGSLIDVILAYPLPIFA